MDLPFTGSGPFDDPCHRLFVFRVDQQPVVLNHSPPQIDAAVVSREEFHLQAVGPACFRDQQRIESVWPDVDVLHVLTVRLNPQLAGGVDGSPESFDGEIDVFDGDGQRRSEADGIAEGVQHQATLQRRIHHRSGVVDCRGE